MEEIEIWRVANQLIERHGKDALVEAVSKQRSAIDQEAKNVWARIAAAVHKLQLSKPSGPLS